MAWDFSALKIASGWHFLWHGPSVGRPPVAANQALMLFHSFQLLSCKQHSNGNLLLSGYIVLKKLPNFLE